jgi:hypothetical protein
MLDPEECNARFGKRLRKHMQHMHMHGGSREEQVRLPIELLRTLEMTRVHPKRAASVDTGNTN